MNPPDSPCALDGVMDIERLANYHRVLLECTGEAICGLDLDGNITFLNQAAARMLRVRPEKALGQSIHTLTHCNPSGSVPFPAASCPICRTALSTHGSHVAHEVFWRPDGSSFPVEYSSYPLWTDEGVRGILLTFSDITGRRIHAQEMHYALACAQCLLWYADVQYVPAKDRLRWFLWPVDEEAARRFLPFPWEPGKTFAEAFYACRLDEDKERTNTHGKQEILAGRNYRQEYRCRLADGEVRWISEVVQVEKVVEDRWRAVGVCTDITDLKQREREIEELNERLHRAMTETHHRVKNNLQVISALMDMQVTHGEDVVSVSEIRRLGQHIRALATIHDLLTRTVRATGEGEVISAKEALEQMMPLILAVAGDRPVRCEVAEVRLPMRQGTALAVLVNELVSNAVKHGQGAIELTLQADGETIRLEVSNDGPGFPSGFDSKTSANTGLELIESLIRWDLQGTVTYENRPDGGARVVVTFPLHVPASQP
jgi:PAS domain S-box-containing protein